MRRAQATNRELGLASLFLLVLALYLYLTNPSLSLPNEILFKEKCILDENLSCYSLFLGRGSKLNLIVAQNTGKIINITSVVCTSMNNATPVMQPLSAPVLITPGERAYVSGGNSGNEVICTGKDGKSIPQERVGDVYEGRLYITYKDKNRVTSFVNGTLITKYS